MHPLSNFTSITVTSFRVKVTCAQKSFRRDFFSDLFATALATSLFPERLFHHAVQRVPKLTSTGVLMVLKMCPARGRVTVARRPLPGLPKSGEAPHRHREGHLRRGLALSHSAASAVRGAMPEKTPPRYSSRSNSGSFAMFAAIWRARSLLGNLAARWLGSSRW
jgi:hypothetical protein